MANGINGRGPCAAWEGSRLCRIGTCAERSVLIQALAPGPGRWRVEDQAQLLSRGATGAHSPDVDQEPAPDRDGGFFLEHFIGAAERFSPLHDGRVVGLEQRQPPDHLGELPLDPG